MGGGGGIVGTILGAGAGFALAGPLGVTGMAGLSAGATGAMIGGGIGGQIGGMVDSMQAAEAAKKGARSQEALQQAQIAEQRAQAEETARINQIKSARAARLQSARIAGAVAGAGVSGGVLDIPLADLNTSLDTTLSSIDKNLAGQENQLNIASSQTSLRAKMAIDSANAEMWKSIGKSAGSILQTGVMAYGSSSKTGYGENFNASDPGWNYGPTADPWGGLNEDQYSNWLEGTTAVG